MSVLNERIRRAVEERFDKSKDVTFIPNDNELRADPLSKRPLTIAFVYDKDFGDEPDEEGDIFLDAPKRVRDEIDRIYKEFYENHSGELLFIDLIHVNTSNRALSSEELLQYTKKTYINNPNNSSTTSSAVEATIVIDAHHEQNNTKWKGHVAQALNRYTSSHLNWSKTGVYGNYSGLDSNAPSINHYIYVDTELLNKMELTDQQLRVVMKPVVHDSYLLLPFRYTRSSKITDPDQIIRQRRLPKTFTTNDAQNTRYVGWSRGMVQLAYNSNKQVVAYQDITALIENLKPYLTTTSENAEDFQDTTDNPNAQTVEYRRALEEIKRLLGFVFEEESDSVNNFPINQQEVIQNLETEFEITEQTIESKEELLNEASLNFQGANDKLRELQDEIRNMNSLVVEQQDNLKQATNVEEQIRGLQNNLRLTRRELELTETKLKNLSQPQESLEKQIDQVQKELEKNKELFTIAQSILENNTCEGEFTNTGRYSRESSQVLENQSGNSQKLRETLTKVKEILANDRPDDFEAFVLTINDLFSVETGFNIDTELSRSIKTLMTDLEFSLVPTDIIIGQDNLNAILGSDLSTVEKYAQFIERAEQKRQKQIQVTEELIRITSVWESQKNKYIDKINSDKVEENQQLELEYSQVVLSDFQNMIDALPEYDEREALVEEIVRIGENESNFQSKYQEVEDLLRNQIDYLNGNLKLLDLTINKKKKLYSEFARKQEESKEIFQELVSGELSKYKLFLEERIFALFNRTSEQQRLVELLNRTELTRKLQKDITCLLESIDPGLIYFTRRNEQLEERKSKLQKRQTEQQKIIGQETVELQKKTLSLQEQLEEQTKFLQELQFNLEEIVDQQNAILEQLERFPNNLENQQNNLIQEIERIEKLKETLQQELVTLRAKKDTILETLKEIQQLEDILQGQEDLTDDEEEEEISFSNLHVQPVYDLAKDWLKTLLSSTSDAKQTFVPSQTLTVVELIKKLKDEELSDIAQAWQQQRLGQTLDFQDAS